MSSERDRWSYLWIVGPWLALTVVGNFWKDAREQRERRENELDALRDSTRVVESSETKFQQILAAIDSARAARWRRRLPGAPAQTALADSLRWAVERDSMRLEAIRGMTANSVHEDHVAIALRTLGAEAHYWQSCKATCDATLARLLEARIDGEQITHGVVTDRLAQNSAIRKERVTRRKVALADAARRATGALISAWVLFIIGIITLSIATLRGLNRTQNILRRYLRINTATGRSDTARRSLFRRIFAGQSQRAVKAVGRLLLWLDRSVVLLLLVGGLPAYGFVIRRWWPVVVGIVLYGLQELVHTYNRGSLKLRFEHRLGVILSSLAGGVSTFSQRYVLFGSLTEPEAKGVCQGLLGRVRQLTELSLGAPRQGSMRATLALPITDKATSKVELITNSAVTHIRVWCYDDHYRNRRWSTIPIDLPGGPEAFRTGKTTILDDLTLLEVPPELLPTDFRSVVSIAVQFADTPIAVLSVDSPEPNVFTRERVDRLVPIIRPVIELLALTLLTIPLTERYEFGV